jgi:hypothetical protein
MKRQLRLLFPITEPAARAGKAKTCLSLIAIRPSLAWTSTAAMKENVDAWLAIASENQQLFQKWLSYLGIEAPNIP